MKRELRSRFRHETAFTPPPPPVMPDMIYFIYVRNYHANSISIMLIAYLILWTLTSAQRERLHRFILERLSIKPHTPSGHPISKPTQEDGSVFAPFRGAIWGSLPTNTFGSAKTTDTDVMMIRYGLLKIGLKAAYMYVCTIVLYIICCLMWSMTVLMGHGN